MRRGVTDSVGGGFASCSRTSLVEGDSRATLPLPLHCRFIALWITIEAEEGRGAGKNKFQVSTHAVMPSSSTPRSNIQADKCGKVAKKGNKEWGARAQSCDVLHS